MKLKTLLTYSFLCVPIVAFSLGGVLPGLGTDVSPYKIEDYADLKKVGTTPYTKAKVFELAANIDASLSATENGGLGFIPIGTNSAPFTGKFYGKGKTISNLVINRSTSDYVGLFGYLNTNAIVDSVGMVNCNIKGRNYVGAIAGYCKSSTINNCYNTDSVIALINYAGGIAGYGLSAGITNCRNSGIVASQNFYAGGIVAYTATVTLANCYNIGNIGSTESVGGIVGYGTSNTHISNCFNYGAIFSFNKEAGGIIGRLNSGSITTCYNTGSISGGTYYAGGLVGYSTSATIRLSYNTGACNGSSNVGGIIGNAYTNTLIYNSYNTGDVSGTTSTIGGLIGQAFNVTGDSCYNAGGFIGNTNSGGFIGFNYNSTFTNSYFDTQTTGTTTDVGFGGNPPNIQGLTTELMKNNASMPGLDFNSIWSIRNDTIYPALANINNAPFAYNDTLWVSARAITEGINFSSFMENDFDYETLQDSLVYKLLSINNGTTDSLSTLFFLGTPVNGETITMQYRIGEKNAYLPDTLWGNTAKVIAILQDKAPQLISTTFSTNEDIVATFNLDAIDEDNDTILFSILDSAKHASIVLNKNSITYSPHLNFNGNDSIQVAISDGLLQQSVWIKITVMPINDLPIISDTILYWVAGLPVSVKLNVSDVDDSLFTRHIALAPKNGTVSISGDSLTYSSQPFFTGKDTISWFATDAQSGSSESALVVINLTAAQLSVSENTVNIPAAATQINTIQVTSNTIWSASSSASWLTVTPTSSYGNSTLLIEALENTDSVAREATITLTALGVAPQQITIYQKEKVFILLKSFSGSFESCKETPVVLNYSIYSGSPTHYRIIYDSEALEAGFTQTDYALLPTAGSNGSIEINMPAQAKYGSYTATLQLKNELLVESNPYPFTFYVGLPESYIVNTPATVLKIDSKEYAITNYQWYKNGEILPNENSAIYTDMEGFNGLYKAKCWTANGDSLFTCEKNVFNYSNAYKIARIFPNPVAQNEPFTIEFSDPISKAFSSITIRIFDSMGKLVYQTTSNGAKKQLLFEKAAGTYVVHLSLDRGEEYSFVLVVKE
jgi:hypothetical protein